MKTTEVDFFEQVDRRQFRVGSQRGEVGKGERESSKGGNFFSSFWREKKEQKGSIVTGEG